MIYYIIRATTPSVKLKSDTDLTDATVKVSIKDVFGNVITSDGIVSNQYYITADFTLEQTKKLNAGDGYIQVRALKDSKIIANIAVPITISEALDESVIS